MAISMSLYQVTDDVNVLGKSIPTPTSTHTILLKDGCSIDRPVVTFSAMASALAPLNYAYIDTFQRYYWIVDRKSLHNGIMELTLESDLLESFKAQLLQRHATINRNENIAQAYLNDAQYQAMAYQAIATKRFSGELNDFSYILMTVG